MTEFYYRYDDFLQGSGGYDIHGEWEPGPSVVRVQVAMFRVIKRTPKGAWISVSGDKRFIADRWFKKFANPTKEGAKRDFLARKRVLISVAERRIRDAKIAMATVEKGVEEPNSLKELPTILKRVYSWEMELLK